MGVAAAVSQGRPVNSRGVKIPHKNKMLGAEVVCVCELVKSVKHIKGGIRGAVYDTNYNLKFVDVKFAPY